MRIAKKVIVSLHETPLRRPDAPADAMSAVESTLFGVDRFCWRRWLLDKNTACGDRAGALPIDKTHLYHHRQGLENILIIPENSTSLPR